MASPAALNEHKDLAVAAGTSTVTAPDGRTNFLVSASKESVANYAREGNDLIVSFKNGQTLRIEGFFTNGAQYNNLVFVQEDGRWLASFDQAMVPGGDGIADGAVAYQSIGMSTATKALLGALGLAAGIGIGAAAAGGGGGGDGGNNGGGGGGGGGGTTPPGQGTAPSPPSVAPVGNVIPGTGTQFTRDASPTLSGNISPANGSVLIAIDGQPPVRVTADANGNWSYAVPQLGEGTHQIVLTHVNADGTQSTPIAIDVIVDTIVPDAPTIDPTSGAALTGTAEAGSLVSIDLDGDGRPDATVTADANGNWRYTPATPLANGAVVSVTATDAAGNTSAATPGTVDASAPGAPIILQSDTSALAGTAEAGSTIHIDLNGDGTPDATVVADAGGNWSYTIATPVAAGAAVSVTASDAAGNTSPPATATLADVTPPALPTIAATNGASLSGTAEAGSTVGIDLDGDGAMDVTVTATGTGSWSYTPATPIANGTVVTVTALDAAGNASAPASITVDAAAPDAPVLGSVTDDATPGTGPLTTGASTNDATPTLAGTAEANSTIDIYNGTTLLGTVTADANGNWSFTPGAALPDGTYALTVTATDAVGNVSNPSTPFSLTIDTAPPAAPTIAATNGGALSGTAAANSTVAIDLNGDGVPEATVTATPGGTWSYTPAPALANGTVVTVTTVDAAGNASTPASTTVDAAAPNAPVFGTVTDNVAPGTDPVASGGSTNDPTPTFTGTAEPGSTVNVYNGTTLVGTALVDGNGNWSVTPASGLADGTYSFTATATDPLGNVSQAGGPFALTIDTAPPAMPLITQSSATTLAGTAVAGSIIAIDLNNDGTPDVTVTATPAGTWSYSPGTPFGDGTTIGVSAVDAAGNSSTPATVTIDAAPPAPPVIVSVADNVTPGTDPVGNGGSTNDNTPTIAGTAEAGSTVQIFNGTTLLGTVVATGGNWTFTPPAGLADGTYTITVTATDAAGNVSAPSAPYTIVIDTAPPPAPVITGASDDALPGVGAIANGGATNDTTPTLTGTAAAGAVINLYNGTTLIGTTTADANGNWSVTPTAALAPNATYGLTVTATDAAGNESAPSLVYTITVDTAPPPTPSVAATNGTTLTGTAEAGATVNIDLNNDGTPDATVQADGSGNWSYLPATPLPNGTVVSVTATDAAGNASGAATTTVDGSIVDTTPPAAPTIAATNGTVLTGTAEAGSTVNLDLNGDGTADVTVQANSAGTWTYTPGTRVPDGTVVSATATDAAGNTGPAGAAIVDGTAPAQPAILFATDPRGPILSGGSTNDTTPTLTGTAEAGSTVSVYEGTTLLGTVVATGGNWTFTLPTGANDGSHTYTVTAKDAVGNVSTPSPGYTVVVDTAAPGVPTIAPTNGTTLTGTAEAGSTVNLDLNGDGTPDTTVTATPGGTWTYTPVPPLGNGTVVNVTATDAAGNTSGAATLTVDRAAPAAPAITSVTDNATPVTGPILTGGSTNDNTPTLTGTAEANSTVSLFNGTTLIGTANADANGNWSFTPATGLTDGTYTLTATATDAVGNVSAPTPAFTVTIDTVPPGVPTIAPTNGTALSGTADPGTLVRIDFNGDGVADATVTATPGGTWTFSPAPPLGNGTVITVTSVDAAGNVSAPASTAIDSAPPAPPVFTGAFDDVGPVTGAIAAGGATNDPTPTLTGTAEANSTVNLYNGTTLLGTVTANGSGVWTFTPTANLPDGTYAVTATATDALGNAGAPSAAFTFTIDTAPPAPPVIAPSNGNVLTGTAAAGSTIAIDLNGDGTADAQVTANASGNWTYTPATPLLNGVTVSAVAIDAAGNASTPATTVIDRAAPSAPIIAGATDDAAPIVGPVPSGGVTNDTTPTLTGTAEAGSTVRLYNGTTLVGTAVANGLGAWSITPSPALIDGSYSLTATATDAAGNVSGQSAAFNVIIDTTPPAVPTINPSNGAIGAVLTGTAAAGSTVNIDLNGDGAADVTVTATAGGTWSYTLAAPIANGTVVNVTATDAAGSTSTPASVTIDGVAPAIPVIVSVTDNAGPVLGAVLAGGSTNDTTPTLTGTAEPNSTINVFNGITLLGTVTADVNGNWTFTPGTALADGTYTLTVTATDASGNTSTPTGTFTLIVDTVAPPPPIVAASNGTTITGTAAPNSTIALDLNGDGTPDATVTANGAGAWTYTPAPALANGTTVSVVAIDAAGNTSAPATTVIDAAPPLAPVISGVADNTAPVTGPVLSGGSTNDTTPTLTGTAEANSTINIFNGTTLVGTTNADANGNWTFTPAKGLPEGTYTLTATATDAVGNTGAPSAVFTVIIDVTPPAAPVIDINTAATLGGTAVAGTTIGLDLNNDGTVDTTVTTDASGNWTYTPATPLANGVVVNVTAIDAAGNSSPPATVTIDAAAPAAPVLVSVTDNVAPVTAPILSGGSTNDGTPTLTGTAEAGSTIDIYNGTTLIGTVTATGGAWTFTPPDDLADGTYTLTITATDAAGNVSAPSTPFVLTIDTAPPATPIIVSVTDNFGPVLGAVAPGGFSNDNTPTLAGTAEANSTVSIFNGATLVGTAATNASGNWTFTPGTGLADGTYTFTAVATDAAGNPSGASTSFTVTIDTAPPPPPTIVPTDGIALSGTGEAGSFVNIDLNGDGVADATVGVNASGNWSYQPATPLGNGVVVTVTATDRAGNANPTGASTTVNVNLNDTTPPAVPTIAATNGTVLAGTAEAGSRVNIDLTGDGVADVFVTASAGGAWTYTPPVRLGNGIVVTVTATDAAGNTSPSASTTVDAAPPAAPVLLTVTDDAAPTLGTILAGGATNDTTPTLTGTAEAGSIVNLYNGTTLLGTVTATGGTWTFTPPALADGTYTITATATDAVGNTSVASGGFTFRVDTAAPALPTVGASNGATLSGTAEAGSLVGLDFNGDGIADATVTATAGGTWTYTPASPLVNGTVVAVTATDAAGNVSAPASTTIDRLAPAVPIIVSVSDDVAPVVGGIALGGRTNDTTPTLAGTAEAGSTVSVFNGATLLGTAVADANGNWSFTTPALANGTYALTATATDAVGNVSAATAPYGFTVDTIAPVAPVITRASGTTLTGTAEAGSIVAIDLNGDGVADVSVTATAGGTWSFSPSPALGNGVVVGVTSIDAAGNTSPRVTATVDALAPTVPVITSVVDNVAPVTGTLLSGASTNDTTPTLNGTAEAGSLISVFNGATLLGTVLVDGTGNWSFTPTALGNGTYALTVTATDASGNVSAPTAAFNLTVDTVAPTVTTAITTVTDDTGTVGDWVTGDTTPIVGGTLSAALGAGEVLQVSLNGGATWTNAIVTGNTWTWYSSGVLANGSYTISTRVVDAAGNIGGIASQALTINQNVAPQVTVRDAGGLLGIADANALGLIELGQQQFFAASDYNDNIQRVQISFGGVLDLLALQTLNANQTLAAELGLRFTVVNNPGVLGVGASSLLTITSLDGGPIDNLHLNELLGSVTLSNGLLGINVGLLNSLTITATDTTGLTSTSNASQLLSAGVLSNLLGGSQSSSIIEGTTAANTLNGTAGDDRMYGYAGNDTLNGGGGNDLLRGGAGNDTLNGGAGNDILIGGSGNDTLTGGAGGDVFLWEVNGTDNTAGNGSDVITDFVVASGPNQAGADRIDISALLVGYQADADGPAHYVNGVATIDAGDAIRNFVSVTNVNGNTVIAIDRDGTGAAFSSQTVVTLNNVTTNLETLLANHQLVV
ncbi:Ig-like domain-containing protein [Cupriavidus plantarum]|uniref:Putative secreted protein (Type I secretion substrate) n=2 Tax=Cupriavidus plantarum TaxID=942865 RepID=A0A316ER50_9BURK|nr:Ig-like domain-containing protein [Cupriavidus plantarum]PWK34954.1 putative secreted protein (type I secretion substrate) [Cupriavidus plantarum]